MIDRSFQPDWFSKPGDTLSVMVRQRNFSVQELAAKLQTDPAVARGLLAGTISIDEEKADKLAKHVGGSRSFWITRQLQFDDALSKVADAVPEQIGTAWAKRFSLKEMSDYAWINRPTRRSDIIKAYLAYFGVSSPSEWEQRYARVLANVAFRTSQTFESQIGPLSAWLRQGELEASFVETEPFDKIRLRNSLLKLRKLSRQKSPANFVPKIREICAAAGVAVVLVRAPSGCRASGATRFIGPNKAMVVLSFRHRSDDHFWFTLFHELAHLILHGEGMTFVDGDGNSEGDREKEANTFAQNILIPLDRHDELHFLGPQAQGVIRFAVSVGIASGVVVGQLQHLGIIGRDKLNFLKRRYDWEELSSVFN
jgi:HTH-type transcriptional regulator/antitoxin HigA